MEDELEQLKQSQLSSVDHIEVYDKLYKIIISSAATASGKSYEELGECRERKYKQYQKNPAEWWDEECQKVVEQKKKKLTKFKDIFRIEDFIEFKKAKAEAVKTINRKKRDNFKRFITTINKNTNMSYVWNKMKVLKKSSKTVEWTKWQNKDRKKECVKVMQELSPDWAQEERKKILTREKDNEDKLNSDISKEETRRAIKCCKMSLAPGLDHIEYGMLKRLSDEYIGIITEIFNGCFKTGRVPKQYKEYQVIFIQNLGKKK